MDLPQTCTIPFVPPSLNEIMRMNPYAKGRVAYQWKGYILAYVVQSGPIGSFWRKLREEKPRLRVQITFHHSREFDEDNAYGAAKVIFDSMRFRGIIWDDRSEFCEQVVNQEQCPHKDRHTVIRIERAVAKEENEGKKEKAS